MAKKGFGFKPKENGGVIRGPGTGTSDSIATEMQPGTYIMPADSTRTIGDEALKKMADAKVPVRVSNGEFEFTPEQVQSVGAAVLTALRPSADLKNIHLEAQNFPVETVMVDKLKLQKVLLNLLSNAIKYTPENGKIKMSIDLLDPPV